MPVLKTERETRTVKLQNIEGGEVTLYTEPTAADLEKILNYTENGKVNAIVKTLVTLIKEWNLTDEAGNALPVDEANVGKLHFKDCELLATVVKITTEQLEKKA